MAKSKRMINSNLVNASSFKMQYSNKAKLLYFYIMLNADDKGFCDNADELVVLLDSNDRIFHNEASLDLMEHGYAQALQELVDRHLLLVFENKYKDKVYLVRQWYMHNQIPKDRITETTYVKYLEKVAINDENEYDLIENLTNNETKSTMDKTEEKEPTPSNGDKKWEEQWDSFLEDIKQVGKENEK